VDDYTWYMVFPFHSHKSGSLKKKVWWDVVITIPDNVLHVIVTDLEASGLAGCKIVADIIRMQRQTTEKKQ
jgi:hypothetical protein